MISNVILNFAHSLITVLLRSRHIILILILLPCCALASDRKGRTWYGDFSASLGGGIYRYEDSKDIEVLNSVGDVSATWGFKSKKVVFKNDFKLSSDYVVSDRQGATLNFDENDDYTGSVEYSIQKQDAYKLLSNWEVSFTPSAKNSFFAFYKWDNQNNSPIKLVANADVHDYLDTPIEELKYAFSYQESDNNHYENRAGFRWDHNFEDPDKNLQSKFEARFFMNDYSSEWYKGHYDQEQEIDNHFFETPDHYTVETYLSSKYQDLSPWRVRGLRLFCTMDVIHQRNIDDKNTLTIKETTGWTHKTKNEYFNYSNLTVDPRLQAKYSLRKFAFDLTLVPELYFFKLSDKEHFGGYTNSRPAILIDGSATYSINEHHFLKAGLTRSIKRPSYLNLCWFRRQGAYINEFYDGNTQLKPEISNRFYGEYIFRKGRYTFTGTLTNTYQSNKIELIFDEEDGEEGNKIRIYSWINGGWSRTSNLRLNNTWSGKKLSATFGGDINHFYGEARNGNVSKNFDYRINGSVQYQLKDWIFLVRGNYQSKIIRTYNSITEYVKLDFRIEKKFNHFSVYLEGKDVLDKPIETVTYSEDQTKWRLESVDNNRRRFIIGLRYKF